MLRRGEEGWLSRQEPRGGGEVWGSYRNSRSKAFNPPPARRPLGSGQDSGGARQRGARSPGLGSREESAEPGAGERGSGAASTAADAGARRPFPAGSRGVKAREQRELPPPPPAAARLWKYDLK